MRTELSANPVRRDQVRPDPAPPVPTAVVAGAVALVASVLPLLSQLPHERAKVDATLPVMAWFVLGVAGVVLLDRRPRAAVGWACVVAAATPAVMVLVGHLWTGGDPAEPEVVRVAAEAGPVALVALGLPAIAAAFPRTRSRGERRWSVWIGVACVLALGSASAAWFWSTPTAFGAVASVGVVGVAVVVGLSGFVTEPRPVVEPLVDAGLAAAGVATVAATGGIVLQVARHEQIFGAVALSAVASAASAALALSAIWWLRREFLRRRYGSGVLSAEEISVLTSDLKSAVDPRALLVKAGAMVSATSGVAETQLVLDEVPVPEGWVGRDLQVGDELVGTMLLRPSHPGGLEARQDKVCQQLLPTVALVARAVALAIEAAHARDDVAYQRDLERSRILGDLHDDLGPVLAGMSMRVQAARETHHLDDLDDLAADLATCRADLRRIVSGLAPAALRDGDLAAAISELVASFDTGPLTRVTLATAVPGPIDPESSVVIYRAIAEGLTNANKHANASRVEVRVERSVDGLRVEVVDDGDGGAVVPGVGLQSLGGRVAELGGTLTVEAAEPSGTRLAILIPEAS